MWHHELESLVETQRVAPVFKETRFAGTPNPTYQKWDLPVSGRNMLAQEVALDDTGRTCHNQHALEAGQRLSKVQGQKEHACLCRGKPAWLLRCYTRRLDTMYKGKTWLCLEVTWMQHNGSDLTFRNRFPNVLPTSSTATWSSTIGIPSSRPRPTHPAAGATAWKRRASWRALWSRDVKLQPWDGERQEDIPNREIINGYKYKF